MFDNELFQKIIFEVYKYYYGSGKLFYCMDGLDDLDDLDGSFKVARQLFRTYSSGVRV